MECVTVKTSLAEMAPFIDGCFQEGYTLTLTVTGNSMQPLLRHQRDQVVLAQTDGILKKGDVPLYIRENGQYVLHRIMKARDGAYTMAGDAQAALEPGVRPEQIVGVAVAFCRKGRRIDCRSAGYRLYAWLWGGLRPVRPYLLRIYRVCHRLFHKGKAV